MIGYLDNILLNYYILDVAFSADGNCLEFKETYTSEQGT